MSDRPSVDSITLVNEPTISFVGLQGFLKRGAMLGETEARAADVAERRCLGGMGMAR